jgi:hypothetical protein
MDQNTFTLHRMRNLADDPARAAELSRIYGKWSIDTTLTGAAADAEFASKVDECFWQATLLLGATGTSNQPGHDFFVMHALTSAMCLPSMLAILPDPVHKVQLLQGYVRGTALLILLRGRPRIDVPLLMSYTEFPHPPAATQPSGTMQTMGDPRVAGETNPWLAILQNALHHKESHVIKTVRALYYCAQRYGGTPPGAFIGACDEDGAETHVGIGAVDGTVFVRLAGVVSDVLGWVSYGAKEGDWDLSDLGLGWNPAPAY